MFEWLFRASNRLKYAALLIIFLCGVGLGYYFSQLNNTESNPNLGGPTIIRSPNKTKEILIYEKRELLDVRPNNLNRMQITGFIKDLNGDEQILYSFIDDPFKRAKNQNYLIPTATLTKDNFIFLSGVGEKNYVILSLEGDNLTDRLPSKLQDGNFLMSENRKAVAVKDLRTIAVFENNKSFDASILPIPENTFAFLEGFSEDRTDIYVSKKGNPSSAELFRLNLAQKELYKYDSLEGARSDQIKICAAKEKGFYIKHALNPTEPPYGQPIGPSSVMLLDLQSDTVSEIVSSKNLFTDLFASCESEKILVKENNAWKLFAIDGKELTNKLLPDDEILAFSPDGKKAVIRNKILRDPLLYSFSIRNLKNGEFTLIGQDTADSQQNKIRYNVVGMISIPK